MLSIAWAACGGGGGGSGGRPQTGSGGGGAPLTGETDGPGGTTAAGTGGDTPATEDGAMDAAPKAQGPVAPGEVCARVAQLQCEAEQVCCPDPGRDVAECQRGMEAFCRDELHIDTISTFERSGYDADYLRIALDRFQTFVATCNPEITAWGGSYEGLMGAFRGTIDPGESCAPTLAGGEDERFASLASCRQGAAYACMPRLEVTGPIWSCAARVGAGGSCVSDLNCLDGMWCDNPDRWIDGTCRERRAIGEACEAPNQCLSLLCKRGSCVEPTRVSAYCLDNG